MTTSNAPHRQLGRSPQVFRKAARTEARRGFDQFGRGKAAQLSPEFFWRGHEQRMQLVGSRSPLIVRLTTVENGRRRERKVKRSQQQQWQGWRLDESSAEAYERYLVPLLFAPGAEGIIELAAVKFGERVVDVACGTGIVARLAAARVGSGGKVVGLDVNEGMLEVARSVSRTIYPPIEWRRGDAADMPFANETFDVICCQQGLQFFENRPAALGEMHRVLAPDGRLLLSILRSTKHNPGWAALAETLEWYVGQEAGAIMRSPFPTLSADELRELLAGAGFRDVHISIGIGPVRYPSAEEFLQLEAVSSPLAAPIAALEDNVREALIQYLSDALVEYTGDDRIIFPAETYLVAARRAEPSDWRE